MPVKPRLFIGSASESLDIAYAVQNNLEHDADCTVWTQGVFNLSEGTLEALLNQLSKSDFGVFLLTPEDIVTIRESTDKTPRDNVIFELGLFIGKLGHKRSFMIVPRNTDLHIPTDLHGITPANYDPNRVNNNEVDAALGPACNKIRNEIRNQGLLDKTVQYPFSLRQLLSQSDIENPNILCGPWPTIHIQGIQHLASQETTRHIDILSTYRIGEIRRALADFKNRSDAKMRICFSNMWDTELAKVYQRKFYDREITYMQNAVYDSITKIIGDCHINTSDPTAIKISEVSSPPVASFEIRLSNQRNTFSYYRIDDTIFFVPLEMRKNQDPPPMAWVINEEVSPIAYQNYKNEYDQMFEESSKIFPS
jgi:CAP12/Pycsar effector protein, TIR domain